MESNEHNVQVHLRALEQSDLTRLAKLANNRKVWLNVRDGFPHPYTKKSAEAFYDRVHATKPMSTFCIDLDGDLCGMIGIELKEDIYAKNGELGYFVGEPYWNQGIVTQAIGLITLKGFDEFGLNRLEGRVFEHNAGSMRALEKNGYHLEAIAKRSAFKDGKFLNEHVYVRLNPNAVYS